MKKTTEDRQTQKIAIIQLKKQNTSLYNKNIFQIEKINKLTQQVEELKTCRDNYDQFFASFLASQKGFLLKLQSMNQIIVQKSGDSKLIPKFKTAFDTLLEIFDTFNQVENTDKAQFKQTTNKNIKTFVSCFEQIYTEFIIENNGVMEKLINTIKTVQSSQNLNDTTKKIYQDFKESQKKIAELQKQIEDNTNVYDIKQMLDQDITKEKVDQLKKQLQEKEEIHQTLNRRFLLQKQYNQCEKGINQFIENEDLMKSLEIEDFKCKCGSKDIQLLQEQVENKLKTLIEEVKKGNILNIKSKQDSTASIDKMDEEPDSKKDLDQNQLNLNDQQKMNVLKKEKKTLIQEKQQLLKDNKKLLYITKNLEDEFFKSPLYTNLAQQGQELMQYCQQLKQQLIQSKKEIIDIETTRQQEIQQIMDKHSKEISELKEQNNKILQQEHREKFQKHMKEILKDYDLVGFKNEFQAKIKQSQEQQQKAEEEKKIFKQKFENEQKTKNQIEQELKKTSDEYQKFKLEYNAMVIKFGNIDLESVNFRHQKQKQFLQELQVYISNIPNGKEKFTDLVNYIKTREDKINNIEKKIKQLQEQDKKNNKTIEDLYSEIDLTQDGYQNLQNEKISLQKQIKSKEDAESQLKHEKLKEKMQFDQEKQSLHIKIKADTDKIEKQNILIEEIKMQLEKMKQQINVLEQEKENQLQKEKQQNQNYQKIQEQLIELQTKLSLLEKSQVEGQAILEETIQTKEKAENQVREIQIQLQEKQKEMTNSSDQIQQMQIENLQDKLNCKNCSKNDKEVQLIKCRHLFCKECIDKNIKSRNRQCPICRTKFDQSDIKEIYWN